MGQLELEEGDWVTVVPEVYQEGYSLGGLEGYVMDTSSYVLVEIKVRDVRGKQQMKTFKFHKWEVEFNPFGNWSTKGF